MKKIRIKFCDFYKGFDPSNNDFINILKKHFVVELSDKPDYVFYSVFGSSYLKHKCIRIFYTGECVSPNFNLCDYAIGFDYLLLEDRYLRFPLYLFSPYKDSFVSIDKKESKYDKKEGFCSFVVSNDTGMKERVFMFNELSKYKKVSSGGKLFNNVGGMVVNKIDFLSKYKFNICFENCCHNGYTTEKIVEAFAANTIPIYLGNPLIGKEFNEKAFINCNSFKTLNDAIEYIIKIDNNDSLYREMLSEPKIIYKANFNDLELFLLNIFNQSLDNAKRRPNNRLINDCEKEAKFIARRNRLIKPFVRAKNFIRRLKNKSL